jgi:hypothetical protein
LEARLSPNTLPKPLALPQRAQPISLS